MKCSDDCSGLQVFNFPLVPNANKNHLLNNIHFLKASQITSAMSVFRVTCNHPCVTEVKLDGTKIHTAIIFFKSKKGTYFQTFRHFSF